MSKERAGEAAIVPAPWTLRGSGFVLLYALRRPPAALARARGELRVRAGLGALIAARYSESPVGPYDELLWSPGPVALRGRRIGHTIARIVVSSASSRESGRSNWGIPKEMGRFERRGGESAASTLLVRAANGEPLFHARVRPRFAGLRLTALVAPRTLAQLLGDRLYVTKLRGSGKVRLCSVRVLSAGPSRFAGTALPRPLLTLSISDLTLRFPAARILPRR